MTEVIFNQLGAELRIQDGGAHDVRPRWKTALNEGLGSLSVAIKMSRNFKIDTYDVSWS